MANKKIEEIEGIGPSFGEKLREAGVNDTDALLDRAKTRAGRKKLAEETGISDSMVLKWANMADLFRISGVGSEYAELLEASGVDTVKELAMRNAVNLAVKMAEVNNDKNLTRRVPTEADVIKWVDQAKDLPQMITH